MKVALIFNSHQRSSFCQLVHLGRCQIAEGRARMLQSLPASMRYMRHLEYISFTLKSAYRKYHFPRQKEEFESGESHRLRSYLVDEALDLNAPTFMWNRIQNCQRIV